MFWFNTFFKFKMISLYLGVRKTMHSTPQAVQQKEFENHWFRNPDALTVKGTNVI